MHSLCSLLGVFCLQLPSLVSDSSYVCCEYVLLPLVNKEAALAYGREEYSKVKMQAEIEEERRQSQADAMWLLKKKGAYW